MSAPSLSRHVFTTSRLAEFSSKKELVNQTGHAVETGLAVKVVNSNARDSIRRAARNGIEGDKLTPSQLLWRWALRNEDS